MMKNENIQLVVLGISHKTSTISEREELQINKKELPVALNYFKSKKEVEGVVIISTCNRLEFYLVLNQVSDPFIMVKDYYLNKKQFKAENKRKLFYIYRQFDVAKHLFRVISGLESVLQGEYQIQGQVKDAYSVACSQKTAEKILHKLFHAAFRTGKSVRTQTKIGSGKQSLSGVAFQLMNGVITNEDVVTLVGVNENIKIISEKLNRAGFKNLNFVNRTRYKADELAEKYNGRAYSLTRIDEALSNSKCLFSCTGSPEFVITSDTINKNFDKTGNPELIIDMAIPRDVETTGVTRKIKIFNLEDLKVYLEKQKVISRLDISIAEKIIEDETFIFQIWSEAQKDEVFAPFAEKIELIRRQLIDEINTEFSEEEIKLLDKFSRSLIHRIKAVITQVLLAKTNQSKAS